MILSFQILLQILSEPFLLSQVCIKEARGLPPALAHFVFCQYNFWGHAESVVVPPEINPENLTKHDDDTVSFTFNHEKV